MKQLILMTFIAASDGTMDFRVGNLFFSSKFDSGNLARVERVARDDDCEPSKYLSISDE